MRLLTDENIARSVVFGLRDAGHDVLSAREVLRGEADEVVLVRAMSESRVVVTFDKDFGELAFRVRLPSTCGVVFRISQHGRVEDVEIVLKALASREDWSGYSWTVTDESIRQRSLP